MLAEPTRRQVRILRHLQTAAGCDSIVETHLTVDSVSTATIAYRYVVETAH